MKDIVGASDTLPFNQVRDGWTVEVVAYQVNGRRAQRLAELGLTPGEPIRILRATRNQPLLVCVRGTQLALDRQTAQELHVRVLRTSPSGKHARKRRWPFRLRRRRRRHRGRHEQTCEHERDEF